MKKLILILSAASLYSLNVNAQQNAGLLSEKAIFAKTAGKNTAAENRLLSNVRYTVGASGLELRDTSSYIYSSTRGFDSVLNQWKCDTLSGSTFYNGNIIISHLITNAFDAQDKITEQINIGSYYSGGLTVDTTKTIYSYNAQGKSISQEQQVAENGNWRTDSKFIQIYDAQGNLTEWISQLSNTGTLGNASRAVLGYNAQGKPDTSIYYEWSVSATDWEFKSRSINYYNGTSIKSSVSEKYFLSAWTKVDSTIYTLDAKQNTIEKERFWMDAGIWINDAKFLYTYDANNNLTSATFQSSVPNTTLYIDDEQTTISYNSHNQPLIMRDKYYDPGTSQFEIRDEYYYYYEFDNSPLSIKTSQKPQNTVRVYPMPAGNKLTVELKWNEMQNATVVLFDMTGKVAGHWTIPSATQHTQSLDISNVPSGTYMLKVTGTKGTMHQQVNIVR